MIPILDPEQLRQVDAFTIAQEPITPLELMERAARRCADHIIDHYRVGYHGLSSSPPVLVIAGMGNNGGDGLAIARMLHAAGIPVRVVRARHSEPSPENEANWLRLQEAGVERTELAEGDPLSIDPNDLLVDALLGAGTNRVLTGWLAALVKQINAAARPVIAVDMPSGLAAGEDHGNAPHAIVRASFTLVIGTPKLSLLLAQNAPYVGHWQLVPIDLAYAQMPGLQVDHVLVEEQDMLQLLPSRPAHGHKGSFGHALLIAGSIGKAGAAVLAVRAALHGGAGLVSAFIPQDLLDVLQMAAPEAMCTIRDKEAPYALPPLAPYRAVGVGPGLGMEGHNGIMLKNLIGSSSSGLVLDADALNLLAENPTWMAFLPPASVLTPHPREFDRLYGSACTSDHQRLERARAMARKHRCIIVLKGHHTAVCAADGRVYFNSTGNAGMARGGSGDALTGLLTGLLAQGIPPLQATILGVYLHGLAGDLAARHKGMDGMLISDLVAAIPEAWRHLRNASEELFDGAFPLPEHPRFPIG
jgi:ADP-dependent NAD(P)H-hydrate dehydratase / NAD(P)H-hydrate epimerase